MSPHEALPTALPAAAELAREARALHSPGPVIIYTGLPAHAA